MLIFRKMFVYWNLIYWFKFFFPFPTQWMPTCCCWIRVHFNVHFLCVSLYACTIIINYINPNDVYLIITVAALLSTGQRCRYIYLNTVRQRCIIIVCECVRQTHTHWRLKCCWKKIPKKKKTISITLLQPITNRTLPHNII